LRLVTNGNSYEYSLAHNMFKISLKWPIVRSMTSHLHKVVYSTIRVFEVVGVALQANNYWILYPTKLVYTIYLSSYRLTHEPRCQITNSDFKSQTQYHNLRI